MYKRQDISMKGIFMEKSLKKDIIINRLPVVIYLDVYKRQSMKSTRV